MLLRNILIFGFSLLVIQVNAQDLLSPKRILQGNDNEGPLTVLIADLDQDGRNDIICSSTIDDKITWFRSLNNLGSFSSPRIILEANFDVSTIDISDVNLDGYPDLLITSREDDRCYWMKNLILNVKFDNPKVINYNINDPTFIGSADIDGDNIPDIVIGSGNGKKIVWHKNNNDSGNQFGVEQIIESNLEGIFSIQSGDMDNDGDIDLVASSFVNDEFVWYENTNGLGQFSSKKILDANANGAYSVAIADLNDDDLLDIVTSSFFTGEVSWYENNGNKTFKTKTVINNEYPGITEIRTGDFNNDGDQDIAVALGAANGLVSYNNSNNGNFGNANVISRENKYTISIALGDIDNDGFTDMVAASYYDDNITWYRNNQFGSFLTEIKINKSVSYPGKFQFADVNNDGLLDVLTNSLDDNKLAWHRNLGGNRGFDTQKVISADAGASLDFAATDMNQDGIIDIVTIDVRDSTINIFNSINSGNTNSHIVIDKLNGLPLSIITPDVNGDGLPDIVVSQENNNRVYLYKNTGNFNFGNDLQLATNIDGVQHLAYADINGDGNIDLIVPARNDNKLYWYDNQDGNGGYGFKKTIDSNATGVRWVEPADIDGDGDIDIVSSHAESGKIVWYRNVSGGGGFSSPITLASGLNSPRSIDVADYDQDGDMDIMASTLNGSQIIFFENINGTGQFGAAEIISNEVTLPLCINSLDFDTDGDPDLFYASLGKQEFGYFENWTINNCVADDFEVTTSSCIDNEFSFVITSNYELDDVSYSYFINSFNQGTLNNTSETITEPYNASDSPIWTISIADDASSTCEKTYILETPNCMEECILSEIVNITGSCNPGGITYSAIIDFTIDHPLSSTFDLLIENKYFGNYSYEQLPLELNNLPENFSGSSTITICDNDNDLCCISTEIASPCTCNFINITADILSCDPVTSEFFILLDFTPINNGNSSFLIGGNETFYGTFVEADLPITLGPLIADDTNYDILIAGLGDCFSNIEIGQVDCSNFQNCEIQNLALAVEECKNNGNFDLSLDFDITNEIGDEFDVFINDVFYQTYLYSDTNYTISGLAGDCITIYEISILDKITGTCSASTSLSSPICCDIITCEFTNLTITGTECIGDNAILPLLSFDNMDPQGTQFEILINNQSIGLFDYGSSTYPLGQFDGDCVSYYDITVRDVADPSCTASVSMAPICCLDNCGISNLNIDTDCSQSTNIQIIDFDHPFNESSTFVLKILNIPMGEYSYDQLPLSIEFNIPQNMSIPFSILDVESLCEYVENMTVNCQTCEFENLTLTVAPCEETGNFDLFISYTVVDPLSTQFVIYLNGINFGTFDYGSSAISINDLAGDCTTIYTVELKDSMDPECSISQSLDSPICCTIEECLIQNIVTTDISCKAEDTPGFTLNFDYENVSGSTYTVYVDGINYGSYSYANLPKDILLPNVESGSRLLEICDTDTDCCESINITLPSCTIDCLISEINLSPIVCNAAGTKFSTTVNVEYTGAPNDQFSLYINNFLNNIYSYGDTPILLTNIPVINGSYLFTVKDSNDPSCFTEYTLDSIACQTSINEENITDNIRLIPEGNGYKVSLSQSEHYELNIYTTEGRRILSKRLNTEYTVATANYASGLYLISIITQDKRFVFKIMIAQ